VVILTYRRFIKNIYAKILSVLMYTAWVAGIIVALPSFFLFAIVDMENESDKNFMFISNEKTYETRRFSYGFATLEFERYTFKTYREFKYLPFEKFIDESTFFAPGKAFDGVEGNLKLSIKETVGIQTLMFQALGKGHFEKKIK
jgi:hypothetical protein